MRDIGAGVARVDAVVPGPAGAELPALTRLLADVADNLRAAGFRRLAAPPLPPPWWAAALGDAGFRPAPDGASHVTLDL